MSGLLLLPMPMTLPLRAIAAAPVTLVTAGTGLPGPNGIDYYNYGNADKLVLSVHYFDGGAPYSLALLDRNGVYAPFSPASGLHDEVYIAAARSTYGGLYTAGELFTSDGNPGGIAQISADGQTVTDPWVTLPGEKGALRGGLSIDSTGLFSHDLVVATDYGDVWLVNPATKVATFVANVVGAASPQDATNVFIESPLTLPNDPQYGPWAGKIIVACETTRKVYAIDVSTSPATVTAYDFTSAGVTTLPENLTVVPAEPADWYGVQVHAGRVLRVPAVQWADKVGDIIMGVEGPGDLWDIKWDPTCLPAPGCFRVTRLIDGNDATVDGTTGQTIEGWEGATFAPAVLPQVPPIPTATPEAPSSIFFGAGAAFVLLGLGCRSRRRKGHALAD